MSKLKIYIILFFTSFSCKNEKMLPMVTYEVIADGNKLFYQFGSLSGHLTSLAFDKSGILYVADNSNNVILKIDTLGKVSRFAGNGLYAHVDGRDTVASFLGPTGLVFDKQNNLYVSETNFVRKITPAGIVTTIAGSLLDKDNPNERYKDGLALLSRFSDINSIAIDSIGNLYVTDGYNSVVRKISQDKILVTTVAGTGKSGYRDGINTQAEFSYPVGIVFNNKTIYVSDWNNFSIRKIVENSVSTLTGNNKPGFEDGYIANAKFKSPANMVFDKSGSLYIADTGNQAIRKITPTNEVETINLSSTSNSLHSPYGITIYKDNLYVTDGDRVLKIILDKNL